MAEEIPAPTQENKQPTLMESVLGQRIDTKAMVYAPTNEMGVIFLAGFLWDRLGISHIEEMNGNNFPDAIGVKLDGNTGRRYKRIKIEFEYLSSNFKLHGHPIDDCDLIICWQDDWEGCPVKVIELKKERYLKSIKERVHKEQDYRDAFGIALEDLVRVFPDRYKDILKKEIEEKTK